MDLWLSANWLAVYGAVVGTAALLINFVKFRHDIKSSRTYLKVNYAKSDAYEKNILDLKRPETDKPWDGDHPPQIAEVYRIEIVNSGNIEAFIKSAGVVTKSGERKEALAPQRANELILRRLSDLQMKGIPAKSSENYGIYLRRGEEPFEIAYAFAQDKTGKEWKSKRRW